MTDRARRRWPWVLAGVLAVIVAAAAIGWFVWLPRFRPSLHEGESYGIDVSHH